MLQRRWTALIYLLHIWIPSLFSASTSLYIQYLQYSVNEVGSFCWMALYKQVPAFIIIIIIIIIIYYIIIIITIMMCAGNM